jgi:hyperosmotically inducible periplasmic protein
MGKLGWWKTKTTVIAVILTMPLVGSGCGQTIVERIDDTTITTRVKTSMLNDPSIGALNIDVNTHQGVVTLSGRVASQAERDEALALVREVDGVTMVKDALLIGPNE